MVYAALQGEFKVGCIPDNYFGDKVTKKTISSLGLISHNRVLQ
jgi:hypothetical protein